MRCYLGILNNLYKNHVTNEKLCRKFQAAIGKYDEHPTMAKKRKLKWFGRVLRSSGLAKTTLQGTMNGKKYRIRDG